QPQTASVRDTRSRGRCPRSTRAASGRCPRPKDDAWCCPRESRGSSVGAASPSNLPCAGPYLPRPPPADPRDPGAASQSGIIAPMIAPQRTRRRSPVAALVTLLAALALGGCVYRMDVQQGNYLEGKTVDQLQVGMTRTQVRYLLGTPLVPDVFDKDRWD